MKFRACGGLDAPDWLLAGISTLSKMSSVRIKLLAVQIVQRILDDVFDYEKALKLTADSSIDLKACIAALHFLIANAAKFDVDEVTLSRELQQLGLPREHSDSLCRPYRENKELLQAKFSEQCLQVPPLSIAGWQESKDIVIRMIQPDDTKQNKDIYVGLTPEKFQVLLEELKTARSLMESNF